MTQGRNTKNLGAIVVTVAIGAAVALAGGDGGDRAGGMPVFAICAALAFAINWLAFLPAAMHRTERYFDLVGGLTYVSVTIGAVVMSRQLDLRSSLVTGMVLIWAVRLSVFLFLRISRAGSDGRFDEIKTNPLAFLTAWTLQALWVLLTAAAALAVITGGSREPLGAIGIAGIVVWMIGISIEVIADRQKSAFKRDPANEGRFIDVGLWAWSRHPNYFGEIVLWIGMAVVAVPVLQGWQWVTLISPLFVAVLLIRVSGIPLLEKKADERWGGQDEYEEYKRRTPVLIPLPPAKDR